jgi:hypothetical protein
MTTSLLNVPAVRPLSMPRGARIAAALFLRVATWLTRPAPKRVLSRAEEAAAVRSMAYRMQEIDPGFAADLYAAAARHESFGE